MSKRDTYHEVVKQALIQEGWTITQDPYSFDADPQLSTDLGAERLLAAEKQTDKIAVEIKSFLSESQVGELEKAGGQYRLYRRLLAIQEPDRRLVLAVPIHAFDDIFHRQVGQLAMEEFEFNLVVYSLVPGEPLQWNPK
jgi:hypothetical protein